LIQNDCINIFKNKFEIITDIVLTVWAGRVARMGRGEGVYKVLVGKPEGKNHWGDLGVDG